MLTEWSGLKKLIAASALLGIGRQKNYFTPEGIEPVNSNYAVDAGANYITITKSTSASSSYGRSKQQLSALGLESGKTYTLNAKIGGFSQSNLTGLIYISDANSNIKAQTEQIDSLSLDDNLTMAFTYDESTMSELSFYLNRGFGVSNGTYITYSDVTIFED